MVYFSLLAQSNGWHYEDCVLIDFISIALADILQRIAVSEDKMLFNRIIRSVGKTVGMTITTVDELYESCITKTHCTSFIISLHQSISTCLIGHEQTGIAILSCHLP